LEFNRLTIGEIGMKDIRTVTEQERATWPQTIKVDLPEPFRDDRGVIQPLVDMPMESCVMITSKKGSSRANHFHKTDWHYCYVLSGAIDYLHRAHGDDAPALTTHISEGEMFFTPPLVDHTMVFLEDTVFLTWGRNSREQEVYEADVERIPPLNI
jgi:dTDP-4-dehydrorhamnose 3,5-epimerase-like enzyme